MDIIKLMLDKGARDYNRTLWSAAYSGYVDGAKLMLEKGANNYDNAIRIAECNNHTDIIKLIKLYKK